MQFWIDFSSGGSSKSWKTHTCRNVAHECFPSDKDNRVELLLQYHIRLRSCKRSQRRKIRPDAWSIAVIKNCHKVISLEIFCRISSICQRKTLKTKFLFFLCSVSIDGIDQNAKDKLTKALRANFQRYSTTETYLENPRIFNILELSNSIRPRGKLQRVDFMTPFLLVLAAASSASKGLFF